MKRLTNHGFTLLEGLSVLLVIAVVLGVGWFVWGRQHNNQNQPKPKPNTSVTSISNTSVASSSSIKVSGTHLLNTAGQTVRLLGVDAAGTESSCISDTGISPGPLNSSEAQGMRAWHINAVRVPLNEDCWLGINGAPAAYSGVNYRNAIKNWVSVLNSAGITAILDLHWAAPGSYKATGQWPMADADHSPTFWSQVAAAYASTPGVIFDAFNEPYLGGHSPTTADWSCWINGCENTTPLTLTRLKGKVITYQTAGMQQLVDAIRSAGARQPIMVGGLQYARPCGVSVTSATTVICPEMQNLPKDPLRQLIISFHTYSDPHSACTTVTCWNEVLNGAKAANIPIVTGEFGETDCSADYMNSYMNWADQNGVSYLAWTWSVNTSTSCIVGNQPSNHELIADWGGTPTSVSPDGSAFKSHLASIASP